MPDTQPFDNGGWLPPGVTTITLDAFDVDECIVRPDSQAPERLICLRRDEAHIVAAHPDGANVDRP